jgi:hypothetical protein
MQGTYDKSGATKNKEVTLTGALEIIAGNHIHPIITTNGFDFLSTAPLHAPEIDGSFDPADWGDNVTISGALQLTWTEYGTYPLAMAILEAIEFKSAQEGAAIWGKALDEIFADPAISYGDMVAAVDAWAATDPGGDEAVTNTMNIDRAFKRLQAKFFAGQSYDQIKTELLSKSRETWDGERTEVVEEYP